MIRLKDQAFAHFGRRLGQNADLLTGITHGAFVTGAQPSASLEGLGHLGPVILQDDGAAFRETTLLSPEETWFLGQQGRVTVYTNPILYIPERGDPRATDDADVLLTTAVDAANRFREYVRSVNRGLDVLNLFALHHGWLGHDASLLIPHLTDIDGPKGIMLWSWADPFASPKTIEGGLDLLREIPDLGFVRTDLAGLGFGSHGALFTSIGVGTGTRHFASEELPSFADSSDRSPRLLIRPFLAYWKGSHIGEIGDDDLLICDCPTCHGQSLARLIDPDLRQEAAEHSVHSWEALFDELRTIPQSARGDWWLKQVSRALDAIAELADRRYLPESPPKQLRAWAKVLGISA